MYADSIARVQQLWRYPVKSFRGEQIDEVKLDRRGVIGDRAFAVRDADGKLGSGKTTRRFRLLRDLFAFSAATQDGSVVVQLPDGQHRRVGDPALDAFLSARYGEPLAILPEESVPHFDAGRIHVLTTSSLDWVEREHGPTSGDSRRYRPNIVLDTGAEKPLVEQDWLGARLSIGTCVLEVTALVERCVMPTFHQDDLPREADLLRFIVQRNNTMLGVYADVVSPGRIKVGDALTVAR